jgi:hypothetical protein
MPNLFGKQIAYPYDGELVSQDCGPLFTKEKGPKRKSGTVPGRE